MECLPRAAIAGLALRNRRSGRPRPGQLSDCDRPHRGRRTPRSGGANVRWPQRFGVGLLRFPRRLLASYRCPGRRSCGLSGLPGSDEIFQRSGRFGQSLSHRLTGLLPQASRSRSCVEVLPLPAARHRPHNNLGCDHPRAGDVCLPAPANDNARPESHCRPRRRIGSRLGSDLRRSRIADR